MHKWKLEFTVFSLGKWDLGRQDWGLQKKTEDGTKTAAKICGGKWCLFLS